MNCNIGKLKIVREVPIATSFKVDTIKILTIPDTLQNR